MSLWKSPFLKPMLATSIDAVLTDERFIYEPKYDGIRAIVDVPTNGGVRIWSRLGNEKTAQFPEIARALEKLGRKLKASVVLDGEIVALDERGAPTGFQHLQGRIHLTGVKKEDTAWLASRPVAFVAFDILRDGPQDVRSLALVARRARLERIFAHVGTGILRLSEFVPQDGTRLHARAVQHGLEGLIAKHVDSRYESGRRSSAWRKIKLVRRQEFVIGGWTEPRLTRQHFGALLLGVYDGSALEYVGHTGTGFSDAELGRLIKLLTPLERPSCPFVGCPRPNERPHWVEPRLVAEVKFSEWTADGKLRAPVYLALRDDVLPTTVHREPTFGVPPSESRSVFHRPGRRPRTSAVPRWLPQELTRLTEHLLRIETEGGNGTLRLSTGEELDVTHLDKVLWPEMGFTKGHMLRYYVAVSPYLLPLIQDRPLVMRRFPNGISGKSFYQQRAPQRVPAGVRVETVPSDHDVPSRLVGESLLTLLYMAQLAVISQDPWFSTVQAPQEPDQIAFDLDPMPGVTFGRVRDVARWIHDELEEVHIPHALKTSGASGLHIYVPVSRGTTYESGRLFAQIIATGVAAKHPAVATVERGVDVRGSRVYIDYLQNVHGKTLAAAYSAGKRVCRRLRADYLEGA